MEPGAGPRQGCSGNIAQKEPAKEMKRTWAAAEKELFAREVY